MTSHFLDLEHAIAPPPWGPLIGILVAAGVGALGDRLARALRVPTEDAVARCACFLAATAALAAVIHAWVWLGFWLVPGLRCAGGVLCAVGVLWIRSALVRGRAPLTQTFRAWSRLDLPERVAMATALLVVTGLAVSALGPATDADSLEYHLAVPLEWMRHGGAYATPGWFHARLVGLGESINLLGLAMGSEQLGALFAVASLLIASTAVASQGDGPASRAMGCLLVVSVPLMLFLVPNQKVQLLPAACTEVALVLLLRRSEAPRLAEACLALACAAFAAGCKLSFVFSVAVVFALALVQAIRGKWPLPAAAFALLALLALPAPVWARTYLFYGDPVSPFLEGVKASPDPAVMEFRAFLRGESTGAAFLQLARDLVVPRSVGTVSTVLGVGVLGMVLLVRRLRGRAARYACSAAALAALCGAFGQLAPRFLLEAYLWGATALVAAGLGGRARRLLTLGLTAQGCVVAAMAWFGALTLAPGSLTRALRESTMERVALGAAEAYWIDRLLPDDAVVWVQTDSHALTPRPFVMHEQNLSRPRTRSWPGFAEALRGGGVTFIVYSPDSDFFPEEFLRRCTVPIGGPETFSMATRNPFNRKASYRLQAARVEWGRYAPPH